ncbi:MAG: hypothetical protein P4L22_07875 [Candidatus Babeliales bacterium]|nr:hypothetical protein [Candidatus Babeliales bacterium]
MIKSYILLNLLFINLFIFAENTLDTNFGTKGVVVTDFKTISNKLAPFHSHEIITAISIQQADGKIIAGGFSDANNPTFDFALARYTKDGILDKSFGTKGLVLTNVAKTLGLKTESQNFINSIALQRDGKIVVAGYSTATGISLFTLARYETTGKLDTTFGKNGIVSTDVGKIAGFAAGGISTIQAIQLQPDGKIVAGGISTSIDPNGTFALARYESNGTLDINFGTNGALIFDIAEELGSSSKSIDFLNSVALQDDGKIIACGLSTAADPNGSFAVIRLNPNGSFDNSFGLSGIVLTTFGSPSNASAVAIQKVNRENKILVGGVLLTSTGSTPSSAIVLARYDITDGSLDTSFGIGGTVETKFSPTSTDVLTSLIIQPDNKIVAGGYTNVINPHFDFSVLRYDINGNLDPLFGSRGIFIPQFTTTYGSPLAEEVMFYNNLSLQTNGQIIVSGMSSANDLNFDFALIRVNSDGKLDESFGKINNINKGLVLTDFQITLNIPLKCINNINSVLLQPNGKIVTGGFNNLTNPNYNFGVARYNTNGSLDKTANTLGINFTQSFNNLLGVFVSTTPFLGSKDVINSIALNKNGNVVAGGFSNVLSDKIIFTNSFALMQFTKDLIIDGSYGTNGAVVTNFGQTLGKSNLSSDVINSIVIQKDQKIVAAGSTTVENLNGTNFALARYMPNGSLDSSFGNNGLKVVAISKVFGIPILSTDSIRNIVLQPDGKIIAAGFSSAKNPFGDFAISRFKTNGDLDETFGTKGIVLTNFSSILSANPVSQNMGQSVLLLQDGSILVGGLSTALTTIAADPDNQTFNFALAKYTKDGKLDTTFGTKGVVITAFSTVLGKSKLSNDKLGSIGITKGNIIIAGGTSNVNDPKLDFALAAYSENGALITSFGINGVTLTDFKTALGIGADSVDVITPGSKTIAVQKNGEILAVGNSNATNRLYDFALAKYKAIPPCVPGDTFIQTIRNKYN